MTKYELRAVGRMVWGAAITLAEFIWHLYRARECHGHGDDEMSEASLGRAEVCLSRMRLEYMGCGGKIQTRQDDEGSDDACGT